jgi:hypothetical protein
MNRRQFIKHTLSGAALLAAGPLMAACGGTGRKELGLDIPDGPVPSRLDAVRLRMLTYAALAPSGHNTQPWAVRVVSADKWIVAADPHRRLPAVDPQNREVLLSIGAFVENLDTAAGAAGFACDVEMLASSPFDLDILRVNLTPAHPTGYPMARLEKRRTVKNGMRPETLRNADLSALSAPLGDRLHYFARGTAHAECLREATVEAFHVQSRRDDAQRELTAWLRLSRAAARRHRDGLTVESMEIEGAKGWFVRTFIAPGDFMKPNFRRQGVDLTARIAAEGGGWIVITSPGDSVADLIDTGRRFERMALLARERGIAIHPMTQMLEEPEGRQRFAAAHPARIVPQFVLRVGYLDRYPAPVSLRRPVAEFVRAG